MFVLDTNVLSAIMGPRPVAEVAAWLSGQQDELLFTTSISQAEVLSGVAIMPEGRRRRELEAAARAIFMDDFEGRILPFDTAAATAYADVVAARRRAGRAHRAARSHDRRHRARTERHCRDARHWRLRGVRPRAHQSVGDGVSAALILPPSPALTPAALFAPTPKAAQRFVKLFAAQINNDHTR